jgi:PRTRC genetic system protein A
MLKLVQHLVVDENGKLPEIPDCLYAYILAGNGVFLYAKRKGLELLIPVCATRIAGLPSLSPYINLSRRIPACLLMHVLRLSRNHLPNEMLFWFNSKEYWTLEVPQQLTSPCSAVPVENLDETGTSTLVDLHSHGALPPFFSRIDNHDEQGFRIYAVLGQVDKTPSIRVRVGVYGNYFDVPTSTVFEMVDGIIDAFAEETKQDNYEIE